MSWKNARTPWSTSKTSPFSFGVYGLFCAQCVCFQKVHMLINFFSNTSKGRLDQRLQITSAVAAHAISLSNQTLKLVDTGQRIRGVPRGMHRTNICWRSSIRHGKTGTKSTKKCLKNQKEAVSTRLDTSNSSITRDEEAASWVNIQHH